MSRSLYCVLVLAVLSASLASAAYLRSERHEAENVGAIDTLLDALADEGVGSELASLSSAFAEGEDANEKKCGEWAKTEFDATMSRMSLVRAFAKKHPGKSPKELQKLVSPADQKEALRPFAPDGELNYIAYLAHRLSSRNKRACILLERQQQNAAALAARLDGKKPSGATNKLKDAVKKLVLGAAANKNKVGKFLFMETDSEADSEADAEADSESEADSETESESESESEVESEAQDPKDNGGECKVSADCKSLFCYNGKCAAAPAAPTAPGPTRPGGPPKF